MRCRRRLPQKPGVNENGNVELALFASDLASRGGLNSLTDLFLGRRDDREHDIGIEHALGLGLALFDQVDVILLDLGLAGFRLED